MSQGPDITDEALLTRGLSALGPSEAAGKTLVIACGALAREVLAIIEIGQLRHITLTCLPAKLHNTPSDIPKAVEDAVLKHKKDFDQILIAYGDCGTGGLLQDTCERLGVTMIDSPHCYAFFEGTAKFIARGEITAFYLTDFLARQFDTLVYKPLGLDRYPELRDMYFGHYEKLVYLAQTEDAALTTKAREAAQMLGLEFEKRDTGYGDLGPFLNAGS